VLVTKNEEEHLMEDAIGSQIDDYLIKPVNPKQILLTVKKLTDNRRLVSEKTSMAYQQDFLQLGMRLQEDLTIKEWIDTYKKLIYWEIALDKLEDSGMHEVLTMQKADANVIFSNFVESKYVKLIKNNSKCHLLLIQL